MDDWIGLRVAVIVAAWTTVTGGVLLAAMWTAAGGLRAISPEDELIAESGMSPATPTDRTTSFSSSQVGIHGIHGVLGILTASLVTYGALRADDRSSGYGALLVALIVTALPGV